MTMPSKEGGLREEGAALLGLAPLRVGARGALVAQLLRLRVVREDVVDRALLEGIGLRVLLRIEHLKGGRDPTEKKYEGRGASGE